MAVNARTITDDEFFFGHKACAGCGGSLVVRQALKVLGPNAVSALPATAARRISGCRRCRG